VLRVVCAEEKVDNEKYVRTSEQYIRIMKNSQGWMVGCIRWVY
jgi:hypothetical protein